ncbi:MAG TPA: SMP-30/gluconolactonase/LRE family protein [Bryobacteraceae bacterium]|nr:SMP-30/gluconolactonase/LRE family protein [Bryobacteraceae bacterium]
MSRISLAVLAALPLQLLSAQQPRNFPQPGPAKEVTITAIPGVIAAGVKWTEAWHGTQTADGIVGFEGGILFAQEQSNQINRLDKNDKFSVYLTNPHGPGAIAIGPKGEIFVVERTCTDPGGHMGTKPGDCKEPTDVAVLTPERKVIADSVDGKGLGRVNDLVADRHGNIFFTSGAAFHVSPGGKVTAFGQDLRTNGIMLSRNDKILYITNGPGIVEFDLQPDGTARNEREFGKLEGGGNGDGMEIDAAGRLYVTTPSGVQVLGPDGKYLGLIPTPRNAISVAFSGPGKKTLYVACMGAVGPDGQNITTPPGVRNVAMTVYKIPMQAQGFKGRVK